MESEHLAAPIYGNTRSTIQPNSPSPSNMQSNWFLDYKYEYNTWKIIKVFNYGCPYT